MNLIFTLEFNARFGPTRFRVTYSRRGTYEPRKHSLPTDVQVFPHLPGGRKSLGLTRWA